MDKKEFFDIVYIDFSKAFDSVVHNKLILKLRNVGIDGFLLSWISAFLKGRTQRVKINTSCSNPLNVNSGVPQGSVLGPTLFNIFINDLVEQILYSEIYLFADDVKIFSKNSVQLQHDLKAFIEWANIWQLEISFDKCCVLHLGNNNPMIDYYFNDVFLGLNILLRISVYKYQISFHLLHIAITCSLNVREFLLL